MRVRSPGREDPLEEGTAIHSSVPAWRIPWTEEPGGLQPIGLQRIRHDRKNLTHTHTLQVAQWPATQEEAVSWEGRDQRGIPGRGLTIGLPKAWSTSC